MTMAGWLRGSIALASAGWVVPMWLGLWTSLQFVELELMPLLMQQPRLNAFPFLDFAVDCFVVGFLWLGAVIAGWAWVATGRRRSA
ncbi:MAG: hypothetical protein KF800_03710 [Lysobacter sp.]|nr:hypothetical protein [Lysobacter sp.]